MLQKMAGSGPDGAGPVEKAGAPHFNPQSVRTTSGWQGLTLF